MPAASTRRSAGWKLRIYDKLTFASNDVSFVHVRDYVKRCTIGSEPTPLEIAAKAVEMKIVSPDALRVCLEETQFDVGGDPAKTVVDVMLSKGLLRSDEIDFLRASMLSEDYPTNIGGFELVEKIGEGSMGVVYKARQSSMDRVVAVKILSPRLARNARYVARFQREAKAAARLNHPHIVSGIDVGEHQGYHYFAMELVKGRTVQEILEEKGFIPEKRAIEIAVQIADALSHAWDKGLVHRDIKPGNVVIQPDGVAKITDFGLAKYTQEDDISLTDTGTTLGTAYYLSPEQARGESAIDTRSDIYALGATLYHMITGQPPYHGTPVAVMTQHVSGPVPDPKLVKPELSENVCDVIKMMMAKDRRDRYRTPDEVVLDLRRMLEGKKPLLARTDSRIAVLADAAKWEDSTRPDATHQTDFLHLGGRKGWRPKHRIPLSFKILVIALACLTMLFSILYIIEVLKVR